MGALRFTSMEPPKKKRLKITVRGAVQGVGFRPFVYRLANALGLAGWVSNSPQGVFIEAEGPTRLLENFLLRLENEKPPHSFIQSLESSFLDPKGYTAFQILESEAVGEKTALVMPDIATCPECLDEIFNPSNRRTLYPFTNCTHCGPRYSIIESLPYDRANTTMRSFEMCPACDAEYNNPADRRYHAQPNACPECGPHVELWSPKGEVLASGGEAILETVKKIREGKIVAVKGVGGFHLMVDATNNDAVLRLRERKHRQEKPLAVMMPNLEMVQSTCEVSELEARLLRSPEAPIVLLRKRSQIAPSVAPGNPSLGVLLPYTGLHHILLKELDRPVVATSGNLSEEPIVTDEIGALARLNGIADLFLVHNRPIARHVDDSIVRIMAGRELVLRRARGFAPLPVSVKMEAPSILSVGAHLKNTVAQSVGSQVFMSQHIGDLETAETLKAFKEVISSFQTLYGSSPEAIACDLHPRYLSAQFAQGCGLPLICVQHHYAHILACMAENELTGRALGIAWDGTGFGEDGTVWGGEFLLAGDEKFARAGHFRQFLLPGSEKAVQEPRRAALGVLYEIFGNSLFEMKDLLSLEAFSVQELGILRPMMEKNISSPKTSSAGRLFDAVASILGIRQAHRFEGQGAMELEFAMEGHATDEKYPMAWRENRTDSGSQWIFDWEPMVRGILSDLGKNLAVGVISCKFHNTLAETIVRAAAIFGENKIVLSGGCFQNKYLLERAVDRLKEEGFAPYWHQRIPPNDGGIALGQAVAAMRSFKAKDELCGRVASCV